MNALDLTTLRMTFNQGGRQLAAARECEAAVFLEAFGNTEEQLHEEYSEYDSHSLFLSVEDASGTAWGACRIITPGPAGLKTLNDLGREPWALDSGRVTRAADIDLDRVWDIATIGVRKEAGAKRFLIAMALFHGIVAASRANNIPSMVALLDERARRLLASLDYSLSMLPGAQPGEYLGSPSTAPVFGHASTVLSAQRRANPDAYRLMTMGIGLDGIALPTAAEYLVATPDNVIPFPVAMPIPAAMPMQVLVAG
ncbi:MAG: hypothetical protein PHU75_06235 [Candidatus Nanopelagicales bacterium]|nr:hypothetical protein [Candidatus Nanopelagicales bacterium]